MRDLELLVHELEPDHSAALSFPHEGAVQQLWAQRAHREDVRSGVRVCMHRALVGLPASVHAYKFA